MYTSTRKTVKVTASEAIIKGLGPEGGLYLKDKINSDFFNNELLDYSYQDLTKIVFKEFLDDYSLKDISDIVDKAYNQEVFLPQPVVVRNFSRTGFLELFHGRTFAFKDMALSVLPLLFDRAKKINNIKKKTIILTATSGDTGSAALSGFKNLENTFVIVLYPKKGISLFQELQMLAHKEENCFLIPVEGNFDDCQNLVKKIFVTEKPKNSLLSSANSINIGRIIPQVVYYVYSYLELCRRSIISFGDEIDVTVPTGNFGNIYAGSIAKRLGVPIRKFVIASNENKVLTDLFNTYTYNINREFLKTISPSMDILVSSNFERYLYDLTQDTDKVKNYINQLNSKRKVEIPELKDNELFYAAYAKETETKAAIKEVYQKFDYLIDPHTAVAYSCSQEFMRLNNQDRYMLILSTASPFKFSKAVIEAISNQKFYSLEEEIAYLRNLDNSVYDNRINQVLNHRTDDISYSLKGALEKIQKVIGEIDAFN